jgi:hypothetical protein
MMCKPTFNNISAISWWSVYCIHKKLLDFLFQLTTTFVNEIASRIPDGISNIELLPADIILVAKSLEKCLEKSGLVTESNSVC